MSGTFIMSTRQAAELDHAFERNGWTPGEVKKLSQGDTLTQVRSVLLGQAEITVPEHLIDLDADPFVPDGWSVEEHQKGGQFQWDVAKVKFYLASGQEDDKVIRGNNLRKELTKKPVFNANLLDYLLANLSLIPEEWKGKFVFCWGTIYRSPSSHLCVRCLRWGGDDGWRWAFGWLSHGWGYVSPAVVDAS